MMLRKALAVSVALLFVGGGVFAQTSADGGAKAAKAGSVNAVYDFSKGVPSGSKIGSDMSTYSKPTEVAPKADVKGGKLLLEKGETKWKTESYTALYHNNSDSATLANIVSEPKRRKAEYSITIDDAADIEVVVAGNGSKSAARCAALVSVGADGVAKFIVGADNLGDDGQVTLTYKNAPKGKYLLVGNGHRILKVSATN